MLKNINGGEPQFRVHVACVASGEVNNLKFPLGAESTGACPLKERFAAKTHKRTLCRNSRHNLHNLAVQLKLHRFGY